MIKVVYMGTPDFAVLPLRKLVENGYEVVGVVTQKDKAKGRGKTLLPTPVKEEALKHGLRVYQPNKVKETEFIKILRELNPDVIVVAAFGQIIPKEILDMPKFGCINIHASLLPKYRGAAPIQHCILDGEKNTGVTIMKMDVGLDTGDMISKVIIPIEENETAGTLFDKLAIAGADLLIETLPKIVEGKAIYEKQPEDSTTSYAAMIKKSDGLIDFAKTTKEIERAIRAYSPWPGFFGFLNGKMLKIINAHIFSQGQETKEVGKIIKADKSGIYLQCKDGVLVLNKVQLEGKKMLLAEEFIRGHQNLEGNFIKSQR